MSNIKLERVPEELFTLNKLRSIDLSDNKLTEIPAAMGNMKLKYLNVRGSQLKFLPKSFESLLRTDSIHIGDNPLNEYGDENTLGWRDIERMSRGVTYLPQDEPRS